MLMMMTLMIVDASARIKQTQCHPASVVCTVRIYTNISKTRGASSFFYHLWVFKTAGQTDLALHGGSPSFHFKKGISRYFGLAGQGNRRLHLRRWQNLPPIGERRQTRPDFQGSRSTELWNVANKKPKTLKKSHTLSHHIISISQSCP